MENAHSGSALLYRINNGANPNPLKSLCIARIKHLNCVADEGYGENSVESPFRRKSVRF